MSGLAHTSVYIICLYTQMGVGLSLMLLEGLSWIPYVRIQLVVSRALFFNIAPQGNDAANITKICTMT